MKMHNQMETIHNKINTITETIHMKFIAVQEFTEKLGFVQNCNMKPW